MVFTRNYKYPRYQNPFIYSDHWSPTNFAVQTRDVSLTSYSDKKRPRCLMQIRNYAYGSNEWVQFLTLNQDASLFWSKELIVIHGVPTFNTDGSLKCANTISKRKHPSPFRDNRSEPVLNTFSHTTLENTIRTTTI